MFTPLTQPYLLEHGDDWLVLCHIQCNIYIILRIQMYAFISTHTHTHICLYCRYNTSPRKLCVKALTEFMQEPDQEAS